MRRAVSPSLVAFALVAGALLAAEGPRAQSTDKAAVTDGTSIGNTKFLDDGSPVRPSVNIELKEAQGATAKKGSNENAVTLRSFDKLHTLTRGRESKTYEKGVPSKSQNPPGVLTGPGVTTKLEAEPYGRGAGEGKANYTSKDFERLRSSMPGYSTHEKSTAKKNSDNDDAELNVVACKAAAAAGRPLPSFCKPKTIPIDRTFIDRMEAERFDQTRSGPGGFNPNKP